MQSSDQSKLNRNQRFNNNKGDKRRRRPRNKRKQDDNKNDIPIVDKEPNYSMTDLTSEAHALEKQLKELQQQLIINYSSVPNKGKDRVAKAIAIEQIAATEEEIGYVRQSLKKTYRQMFDTDLLYATKHHIEDKIWRYIFYADIESVRSKLRNKPDDKGLEKALLSRIETAFNFYRELNSNIKSTYHIEDTKVFGIELFKHHDKEQLGHLLQFNYICLGDLSRYHAQHATQTRNKKYREYWELTKTCYLKAVDVFRSSGKPYCQLALVSISNGNAIDVVWYYCMSLAVKHPSTVARDNLKSFYSKLKLNSVKPNNDDPSPILLISQFVESFLNMHKTLMFNDSDDRDCFPDIQSITTQLGQVIREIATRQDEKTNTALHILKTTITRTVTITLISIWIAGERLKDKSNFALRPIILSTQVYLYTFVFILFRDLYRASREVFEKDTAEKSLESVIEDTLLPGLGIWSTFISANFSSLLQHCLTSSSRVRDPEKKGLMNAVQSLLSLLITHSSFPDPVLNTLPTTYPISEDLQLLGLVPLVSFHQTVDFFKEQVYSVDHSTEGKRQVRWGRVREMIKKMADSTSFEFIQYNQNEQKYTIVDENAKRQQQNRFMKALATQRLMEQVSSLEKNVNRIANNNNNNKQDTPKDVYTCVVDITAFLDALPKVKKWANQSVGQSVLEVIVPLEVIDLLDGHKKGNSHMNVQARESIRFLDQKLLETKVKEVTTASYLRTQKVSEKLSEWNQAGEYWIGEEMTSKRFDELLPSEQEEESSAEEEEDDDDTASIASSSSSILITTKRRARDEESDVDYSDEEDAYSEVYEYEDLNNEEALGSAGHDDDEHKETSTFDDVPNKYRPLLSCLLFYHKKQQEASPEKPERLVFVTNDEELAYWVELFGDPKTGQRLFVKTVDEWDHMVAKLDFEKSFEYNWKHR